MTGNPTRPPNYQTSLLWSEEEERQLRELSDPARNLRAADIAVHFPGKSRNAIIGKLHRLAIHIARSNGSRPPDSFWGVDDNLRRLVGYYNSPLGYSRAEIAAELGINLRQLRRGIERMRAQGHVKPLKPKPSYGNGKARSTAYSAAARAQARRDARPQVTDLAPEADRSRAVTIMRLTRQTCRWPVEGAGVTMLYCGCPPIGGVPYCAPHARRAFAR